MGRDGYAFRHALLAEAVYDDLLPGERVRLHAAYAKALQQGGVGGTAAELAKHARAANDIATAVRASIAAGDEAMAVAGPDEASRHYELALELATDSGWTTSTSSSSPPGPARRRWRPARPTARWLWPATSCAPPPPTPRRRPGCGCCTSRPRSPSSPTPRADALKVTTEALELLEKHPDEPMRAQMLALHARALSEQRRHDEATEFATEALELADRLGLAGVAADARTTLARLRERPGETAASQAMLEETVAAGPRRPATWPASCAACSTSARCSTRRAGSTSAREEYARTQRRAEETGRPWSPYGLESRVLGIQAAYVLGDWDGARALADLRHESPPDLVEAMIVASGLLVRAGRGDAAALELLPGLVPHGRREGMVSLFAGFAAIDLHGDRGDLAAPSRRTTTPSRPSAGCGRTRTSRPGSGCPGCCSGSSRPRCPASAATTATTWSCRAGRPGGRGPPGGRGCASSRCGTRDPRVAPGWPGSRPSTPGSAGWSARTRPTLDDLVAALGASAVTGFEAFGHVFERARSQARLAAVLHRGRPHRRGRGADRRPRRDRAVAARRAAAARAAHPRRTGRPAGGRPAATSR